MAGVPCVPYVPRYVLNAEADDQSSGDIMGRTNLTMHCSKALSRQVIPLLSNQPTAEEVKGCALFVIL